MRLRRLLFCANYLAENWDEVLQDDSDDNALEIYITPEMARWHELCPRELEADEYLVFQMNA